MEKVMLPIFDSIAQVSCIECLLITLFDGLCGILCIHDLPHEGLSRSLAVLLYCRVLRYGVPLATSIFSAGVAILSSQLL